MLIKNTGETTVTLGDGFGNTISIGAGNVAEVSDNIKPRETESAIERCISFEAKLLKARVVLTPEQVALAHTTPVQVLAPQPKGTVVMPFYAVFTRNTGEDYNAVGFKINDESDGSGVDLITLPDVGLMDAGQPASAVASFDTEEVIVGLQKTGDNGLYVMTDGDAGEDGTCDITVDIFYSLLEIDGVD